MNILNNSLSSIIVFQVETFNYCDYYFKVDLKIAIKPNKVNQYRLN